MRSRADGSRPAFVGLHCSSAFSQENMLQSGGVEWLYALHLQNELDRCLAPHKSTTYLCLSTCRESQTSWRARINGLSQGLAVPCAEVQCVFISTSENFPSCGINFETDVQLSVRNLYYPHIQSMRSRLGAVQCNVHNG